MALPFFYDAGLPETGELTLDEDTSKHISAVLRMQKGEQLLLTDGEGLKAVCEIINDHRKRCEVRVLRSKREGSRASTAIAISLLKNASRFEWFLEKATELGIGSIYPLISKRTESEKFRMERMRGICISATLQSQQAFLPQLSEPLDFRELLSTAYPNKFIAHCIEAQKAPLPHALSQSLVLIGPEGDFTPEEIEIALDAGFKPVTLGDTRLRTETAGLYAAVMLSGAL